MKVKNPKKHQKMLKNLPKKRIKTKSNIMLNYGGGFPIAFFNVV